MEKLEEYTRELQRLQQLTNEQKIWEKRTTELADLIRQADLERNHLAYIRDREQKDVEQLKEPTLANMASRMLGRMEKKRLKEEEEAARARQEYQEKADRLEALKLEMKNAREKLSEVRNADKDYARLLEEKRRKINELCPEKAFTLGNLEAAIVRLDKLYKEAHEAVQAGERAKRALDNALAELQKARDWAKYDVVAGSGIISHSIKHDHLDNAQHAMDEARLALQKFKTELSDLSVRADMQVNFSSGEKIVDYWFDGLFVDLHFLEQIGKSENQVRHTRENLSRSLERLWRMETESEVELREKKALREQLILEAEEEKKP